MTQELFINKNTATWSELEGIYTVICKKSIKALSSKEVKNFLHLFRQCSHHLAYARTYYPDSSVESYLNSLTAKCHSHVYAVKKISIRELVKFISYGFPKSLREYKWYVAGSFCFFLSGFLIGLIMVLYNDNNGSLFLPQQLSDGIKSGTMGEGQWNYPLMSSFIMVNNISVSLRAFVFGITLGLGTIYVLFSNGALLGALTGLVYLHSDSLKYWSLILPHGIIELTAVFISGAAGLMIARSMLMPGEYSRRHALINGTQKAITLIAGVIPMLVIAGIIEGFFTPLDIPGQLKLLFGLITLIALSLYFSVPYFKKK